MPQSGPRRSEVIDALELGLAAQNEGRLPEAQRCFESVLRLDPQHAEALHQLGFIAYQLGNYARSAELIGKAIRHSPADARMRSRLGLANIGLGRLPEALRCFDEALGIKPDYPEALTNRGTVLQRLKRFEKALESFAKALAIRPDFVEALNNRGNVMLDLGRHEEALASYDKALSLKPDHARAWSNRGLALGELNRHEDALASHDKAVQLRADSAEIRRNRSMCRLVLGDFEGGFKDYESRWQVTDFPPSQRAFSEPLWRGNESLAGKTIVLHAEQGLGDAIQFARYAPLVAGKGARVILEVQPALATLLSVIPGVDRVVRAGERAPAADFHCSLMSLPLALGTRLDTIPATIPYLRAAPEALDKWRSLLGPGVSPRIGLVWSGALANPRDGKRSIALEKLLGLGQGAELVSLQNEVRDGDREAIENRRVRHFGAKLADFSDTAALVSLMDLVISVDTSVAHLAGALGKPVWILLPLAPDFRWLLAREDSPWYPTARLFRQRRAGDWDGVIAEVKRAPNERYPSGR